MEKNHMKSTSLVELELVTAPVINTHWHGFIELLYVISGQVKITAGEQTSELKQRDIIVINANRHHSYQGSDDLLLGRFLISDARVQELLEQNPVLFWCNSAAEDHEAFGELRQILNRILNDSMNDSRWNRIYRESLHYRLLHVLCSNFLVPQGDIRLRTDISGDEDRMQEIFAYIRSNYHHNIRLKDLSDTLFLSETYVSRYIKKKCGINFVELVNMVRLEQSMEELVDTSTPVIRIAMDSGFSSVAAYNKYFKERYQMNPTDYRKKIQEERSAAKNAGSPMEDDRRIRDQVAAFLSENPAAAEEPSAKQTGLVIDCDLDPVPFRKKNLTAIVNIGALENLHRTILQEQILSSRDRLGFQYVRFDSPFGEIMHVDIHAPAESLNFGQVDTALDFLIQNQLRPYFELGPKPHRLLRNTENPVFDEAADENEFDSDEQMYEFHLRFLSHLVRRYGADEVRQWFFEVHEQEQLTFVGRSFHFSPLDDTQHQHYFHTFSVIASAFRRVLPDVQIGGGGFPTQHYGEAGLKHVFDLWAAGQEQPDFVTVTGFPYHLEKEGRFYYEKRSTDSDFLLHNIQLVKRAMAQSTLSSRPLHVVEYALTLSSRNIINDSCFRGAFLLRSLISCSRESDVLLGVWTYSDLFADYHDSGSLLFGGPGLLNKNGIPKPAWYAIDFFSSCYPKLVGKNDRVLITADGSGSFFIICHNLKGLTYSYYAAKEDSIAADELPQMFEDLNPLTIRLTFRHIPEKNFRIRRQRVNKDHGNLLQGWREIDLEPDLSREELEHLRRATTYHLSAQNITASNGQLTFDLSLEANEITCIQITPQL